jgi:hypothetical protein
MVGYDWIVVLKAVVCVCLERLESGEMRSFRLGSEGLDILKDVRWVL